VKETAHWRIPLAQRTFYVSLSVLALPLTLASWSLSLHERAEPTVQPRVINSRQITHDGLVKTNLASDGSNLYFTELSGENSVIAKVAASGGEVSRLSLTFPNAQLLDVSPAHSSLLVAENKLGVASEYPFWSLPLDGGAAQRVGVLAGQDAVWAPDGKHVLLVKGSTLFIAEAGGSNAKELASVRGTPYYPRYSPDGKRVRFSVGDVAQNTSSIWEVDADGSGLHAFLPDWTDVSSKCCGNWTADGRYFVFQATEKILGSSGDLFALAESTGVAERPVKLTKGAVSFTRPVPSSDNKKIWAMGLNIRGSVVSYDPGSGKYVPFLSGISASDLDFSRDGQWVAYVSIPEGTLWRCKIDGTQKQQLTFSGRAALPRWSPDGKQIAYVNVLEGKPWGIFVVSARGGTAQPLLAEHRTQIDINWTQDGSNIIFGRITEHKAEGLSIVSYNLKTHRLSTIPGSEGLFSPRLSPDGRYIAALSGDLTKLMLYDTQSQKWSEWQTLESGALNYPVWSPDSKSIYFDDLVSGEGAYCRAKVGESRYEHVFLQNSIERHLGPFGLWSGRAPDGSVLFVQEASTREIYELQVELP
jgi:Tol biopolymer transport system component